MKFLSVAEATVVQRRTWVRKIFNPGPPIITNNTAVGIKTAQLNRPGSQKTGRKIRVVAMSEHHTRNTRFILGDECFSFH